MIDTEPTIKIEIKWDIWNCKFPYMIVNAIKRTMHDISKGISRAEIIRLDDDTARLKLMPNTDFWKHEWNELKIPELLRNIDDICGQGTCLSNRFEQCIGGWSTELRNRIGWDEWSDAVDEELCEKQH